MELEARTAPSLSEALIKDLTSAFPTADAVTLRGMLPAVYDELRHLAAHYLRNERPGHTLQPTALVHEAYLRMMNQHQLIWQNRAQLLGVFARMMRRVLIDHANARLASKRGGKEAVRVSLDESLDVAEKHDFDLIDVDAALQRLERLDPKQERIVEMRIFGGLNVEEIGKALDISSRTVKREWAVAKRWLQRELSPGT